MVRGQLAEYMSWLYITEYETEGKVTKKSNTGVFFNGLLDERKNG